MTSGPEAARLLERDFDPMDQEISENLWDVLAHMRQECPVLRSEAHGGFWVLSRYEDVWQVAHDWETFCSREGVVIVPVDFNVLPENCDPPFQRDLRRAIDPCFSPKVVASWEESIRATARRLVDGWIDDGACEFMSAFARPFPTRVYFEEVLGLDMAEGEKIMGWMETILHHPQQAGEASAHVRGWARQVMAERKDNDRERDIMAALAHATVEGRPLTTEEVCDTLLNLTIGGLDTTANGLGNVIVHLARDPELHARVASMDDPSDAIEEFLRLEAPAPVLSRVATRDVEMRGVTIRKGDRVLIYYGSGNRDGAEFDRPDDLVLDRGRSRHMSFGIGPHRCPGAHLARLEMRVGLEEVLSRVGSLRLVDDDVRARMGLTRGPVEVHLAFEKR